MCSPSCSLFIAGSVFPILAAATEIVHPDIVQYFADIQQQNPFDPRLVPHYHENGTVIRENIIDVTLAACSEKCGTEWNGYPGLDTQKNLASWMIPLFLLIGSMHYASLGVLNTISVINPSSRRSDIELREPDFKTQTPPEASYEVLSRLGLPSLGSSKSRRNDSSGI